MSDPLSKAERSALMAKVRSKDNRSTEVKVATTLARDKISGWKKNPKNIPGKPDFFFPDYELIIFVDGCFWHACPKCDRRIPRTRSDFWKEKIEGNRKRDLRVRNKLRRQGYHVLRIWEHEVNSKSWLNRLYTMMRRIENS